MVQFLNFILKETYVFLSVTANTNTSGHTALIDENIAGRCVENLQNNNKVW